MKGWKGETNVNENAVTKILHAHPNTCEESALSGQKGEEMIGKHY
jgi:hypothetical protein